MVGEKAWLQAQAQVLPLFGRSKFGWSWAKEGRGWNLLARRHYRDRFHQSSRSFVSWFPERYVYHGLSSPLAHHQPSGMHDRSWVMFQLGQLVGEERVPKDAAVYEYPCECEFLYPGPPWYKRVA